MRFVFEADQNLFRFLKRNKLFRVLKTKGLKMSFGWCGRLEIEPIVKKRTSDDPLTHFIYSYFGRFFKIFLMPFDSGRVYINFWNHYEVLVDRFEDVIEAIDDLVARFKKNEPQNVFGLLYKIPEGKECGKRV